jgi:hypothetical protein
MIMLIGGGAGTRLAVVDGCNEAKRRMPKAMDVYQSVERKKMVNKTHGRSVNTLKWGKRGPRARWLDGNAEGMSWVGGA